jgi:ubiquinone/menaquinone biosynthesis C-methylase UbiE
MGIGFKPMYIFGYSKVIDPILRDVRLCTPEFAGMKAGDRVLDVCCGTGEQALHYARKGINATGIDLDPRMIEVAERNRRKRGLGNVSFQLADAQALPFKDDSFDYASVSLALHEKERPARDRVISEMKRVVKAEGALVFIDLSVPLPRKAYACLVRAVEFMAGRDHFRCFRDYIEQGGLDVLLRSSRLHEEKRDYLKHGTVAIIKAKNV